jgi:hypothetical protein
MRYPVQSLNPDSRVLLGEKLDMLGHHRIVLAWRCNRPRPADPPDRDDAEGPALRREPHPPVQLPDWLIAEAMEPPQFGRPCAGEVAICHMCTTRMSAIPARAWSRRLPRALGG